MIVEAVHETEGKFRQLGTVLAGTDTERSSFEVRDGARTDTEALLAGAGYRADEIASLQQEGAVG